MMLDSKPEIYKPENFIKTIPEKITLAPMRQMLKRRCSSPLLNQPAAKCLDGLMKIMDSDDSDVDSTPDSGLSGSGSGSDDKPLPLPLKTSPSPLKMARRRRRVFAQSPISKRTCGQDPDSESSPPCSPIGTRRLRQLALFDAGINNSSVSASPLTPRTPRIAPRRLTESPRWRQSPSAARSGTPKIDPGVTVNPFTPANRNSTSKTRVSLRAAATYRYRVEFHEAGLLGQGQFGAVYKAVNRFDGCVYAVKKIKKPAKGGAYGDASAIREVCAHAVLGKHVNVVRYFSAWCEQNQMFIQSEYCNGGSVADVIQDHRINRLGGFSTEMANELLKQVSSGLNYIHEQDLAHLDIKPANIFRSFSEVVTLEMPDIQHSGPVTYKIGDLGHVTKSTVKSVDEGDCRYMSKEMIDCDMNKADLFKADIFALGMSIYEAVSLMELPQNGPVWHELRSGRVPSILSVDDSLNNLIQKMLNPIYELRPCAKDISEYFRSTQVNEVNAQLQKLLKEEMLKNEKLLMELRAIKAGQDPTCA